MNFEDQITLLEGAIGTPYGERSRLCLERSELVGLRQHQCWLKEREELERLYRPALAGRSRDSL